MNKHSVFDDSLTDIMAILVLRGNAISMPHRNVIGYTRSHNFIVDKLHSVSTINNENIIFDEINNANKQKPKLFSN